MSENVITLIDLWHTTTHHYPCHAIDEFRTERFPEVHEVSWSELGERDPEEADYYCHFRLSSGRTYVITGQPYDWLINLVPDIKG